MGADRSKQMLYGYKVLDFTQFVAGPTVTKLMAEMGAQIIKVELAPTGDLSRTFPYVKDHRSAYFVQQNRGKLSLCVDVKNAAGKAILRGLVPNVDVLVQNYAPGDRADGLRLQERPQTESAHHHVLGFDLRAERASRDQSGLRLYRAGIRGRDLPERRGGGRLLPTRIGGWRRFDLSARVRGGRDSAIA
jgi:hypothetical protein